MVDIQLTSSDYRRLVAKEPYIALKNRFAENNPTLNDSPTSVISRPAMKKFAEVGTGPIRRLYDQPGTFRDDLFVVSNTYLHRVSAVDGTHYQIGQLSSQPIGSISMAATAPIYEEVPAYLYIAEGGVLWCYTDDGSAIAQLQVTGSIANNDTVRIGIYYYRFTTGDVNAGTPDGSSGNPWLVAIGIATGPSLDNLYHAINHTGVPGVQYSSVALQHPAVIANGVSASDLSIIARDPGATGNSIATTETGSGMSWGGSTMAGGGSEQLRQVPVPDDLGAISVAVINSFVIVVPVQHATNKGRFYWIEPGETTIDPLNFATAERSPDGLHQVVVYGDMFWLMGQTTTEPWITTGNPDTPMQRFTGLIYDRGSWEGTALKIKDSFLVIDEDGGVFLIKNGQHRLTQDRPDIEERIRRAILTQQSMI